MNPEFCQLRILEMLCPAPVGRSRDGGPGEELLPERIPRDGLDMLPGLAPLEPVVPGVFPDHITEGAAPVEPAQNRRARLTRGEPVRSLGIEEHSDPIDLEPRGPGVKEDQIMTQIH